MSLCPHGRYSSVECPRCISANFERQSMVDFLLASVLPGYLTRAFDANVHQTVGQLASMIQNQIEQYERRGDSDLKNDSQLHKARRFLEIVRALARQE